ncbi:MAG: 3-isopropylmalate dehydratase large subunit [Candidatus Omnitrophica bacterium]|nr:3-isopropylmalate dehydratase large subunit [Candidatus Omnitrophota bacterium]
MTITEKILAAHSGKKEVVPGDFILADVDLALGNDITAPAAIREFKKAGGKKVFDPEKIVLIPDHFSPAKDLESAQLAKRLKLFAQQQKIPHFYEIGRMGIEHALIPEKGLVLPGNLVVGADSHTCTYGAVGAFATGVGSTDLAAVFISGKCWFKVPATFKFIYYGKLPRWTGGKDIILHTIGDIGVDGAHYKAMEFSGETIKNLAMDDRFTLCNMAIEAGAKNGIIEPGEITWKSDADSNYSEVKEYDVSKIEPQVAFPSSPSNIRPIGEVGEIPIDQVVIGSCTNGRISDLRIAASILKKKKIHPEVRTIIIPATQRIYLDALREGLIDLFIKAGCIVSTPTCGPCLGGHMGVLSEGEVCLSTTNRNFIGRMGSPKSKVYLANPAVAAASAIKGRIAHPERI